MTSIQKPTIDPTQEVRGNETGEAGAYYGNEYDAHDPRQPERVKVGASDGGTAIDPIAATHADGENIPDNAGRRAYIDQRTGEARGSGAGDDFDTDSQNLGD